MSQTTACVSVPLLEDFSTKFNASRRKLRSHRRAKAVAHFSNTRNIRCEGITG